MKIFITGSTGFVGKSVLKELARRKIEVLALTRNRKGTPAKAEGVSYVQGNLRNTAEWLGEVRSFKPHSVIHLAWEGIPDFSPEHCMNNLTNSLNFYQALSTLAITRVVTSGTCAEYGLNQTGKLDESTPLGPFTPFGATKNAVRSIGSELAAQAGYEFVWTRLFYAYGPGQRQGSLIPSLITAASQKNPPLLKNPAARNDFIFVDDAARAIVDLATAKKTLSGVYNVGSGIATSVRDITAIVYGEQSDATEPHEEGFWADISRIKKDVGWEPAVSIKDGIETMLKSKHEPNA